MATYTRHKSLKKQFYGIEIDEHGLARISHLVSHLAEKYEKQVDIIIHTSDDEEMIRTQSSAFFLNPAMPSEIKSVEISYSHYSTPVSCRVRFSAMSRAELTVDGTDSDVVQGTFHDIERELERMYHSHRWLTKILHENHGFTFKGLAFSFVMGFVFALTIYSIFDIFILAAEKNNVGDANLYIGLAFVGWLLVIISFFAGLLLCTEFLGNRFPSVEFTGRLRDKYSDFRSKVGAFILLIIIPIIANIISSFITS